MFPYLNGKIPMPMCALFVCYCCLKPRCYEQSTGICFMTPQNLLYDATVELLTQRCCVDGSSSLIDQDGRKT